MLERLLSVVGICFSGVVGMDPELTSTACRLLVEHSPVMVWRSGLDANCDYFNETWLSFTGRTREQEMGSGWAEGVHREDLDRCVAAYMEHFRRREPFEMEYRLRRHDGVYRWIFDRGVPYMDDTGTFAGFIGSCVDVHVRRTTEEAQRQRSRKQIALARDFEKWILAIVGHDIRNPLNSIQLAALELQDVRDPAGIVKENAEMITRAVDRIEHIVGDLLDVSRERDGAGIPVEPKSIDLCAPCQQIIDELKLSAPGRKITLECCVDGQGSWDEHRILQAISNLASNAVQHGTPGTPVRMLIKGDEQCVVVEVRNEGTIPEEDLAHIFEPFRAADQRGNRRSGLGLGLFIAEAIARAHGGRVEVDSSAGTITSRMFLPRRTRVAKSLKKANGRVESI
jgi:two-component system, OmpR family, sensor histidine kinase VicK